MSAPFTSFHTAPPLSTERLTLSAHTLDDFRDSLSLWIDPRVTRFIGGRPSTEEEVWGRLLRYAGLWSLLGFGYWVVRETASGRFVGEVGLLDGHREIQPTLEGMPEVGWALAPWAHGRGLATEAVRAVLAWADANLPGKTTCCIISPENAPSIRVAEKVGFEAAADTRYHGEATRIFQRAPRGG